MPRRKVWHVRWDAADGVWYIKRSGKRRYKEFNTKQVAVNNAKAVAKNNTPSQLIVHTQTGSTSGVFEYD